FIFLNVAPSEDVRTLLHEGGHAFHAIAAREEPLLAYRNTPLEFAEVASMGMELLSAPYLGTIYPRAADARRALRDLLDGILMPKGMPWIATGDAVARYRSALALGGSRPLPQLFEAAGARLAFGEDTVAPLARALGEELAKAPYA